MLALLAMYLVTAINHPLVVLLSFMVFCLLIHVPMLSLHFHHPLSLHILVVLLRRVMLRLLVRWRKLTNIGVRFLI